MAYETEALVAWLISLAVAGSVAWLALHGWRQGRTLRRWAAGRGLRFRRRDGGRTEACLEPFRRDDDQVVRELGSVREVVDLDRSIRVFRCEERLDLTPWSSGTAPPRTRVAAIFPAAVGGETYSVFDEDGGLTREPAPGLRFADPGVSRELETRIPDPPHPASVTVADGRGLAYLLTPGGDVSCDDLDYLARLARRLAGMPAHADQRVAGPGGPGREPLAGPGRREGTGGGGPGRMSRAG